MMPPACSSGSQDGFRTWPETGALTLTNGIAVGAHGYERWTTTVEFVVPPNARHSIERLWRVAAGSSPLKGFAATIERVEVIYWNVSPPLRENDLSLPLATGELPILGLAALVASKLSAGSSFDLIDVIGLLKLGQVAISEVSRRLSGETRARLRDLVRIAELETQGKPKEGRPILLRLLGEGNSSSA